MSTRQEARDIAYAKYYAVEENITATKEMMVQALAQLESDLASIPSESIDEEMNLELEEMEMGDLPVVMSEEERISTIMSGEAEEIELDLE